MMLIIAFLRALRLCVVTFSCILLARYEGASQSLALGAINTVEADDIDESSLIMSLCQTRQQLYDRH